MADAQKLVKQLVDAYVEYSNPNRVGGMNREQLKERRNNYVHDAELLAPVATAAVLAEIAQALREIEEELKNIPGAVKSLR